MRQNRTLLIFLAILIVIPAAIVLPDYFSCNPLHWSVKSQAESALDAAERDDVQRTIVATRMGAYLQAGAVDGHTFTLVVKRVLPLSDESYTKMTKIYGAWDDSYAKHHGLGVSPCLSIVQVDTNGHELSRGLNRDSVYRQLVNQELW